MFWSHCSMVSSIRTWCPLILPWSQSDSVEWWMSGQLTGLLGHVDLLVPEAAQGLEKPLPDVLFAAV